MYLSQQYGRPRPRGLYLAGGATTKLRRASRTLRYLAAITPEQATEQIFPQARVGRSPGHDQGARDAILASAQQGTFALQAGGRYQALPALCQVGGRAPGMLKPVLVSTAGGLALKFAAATRPAAPFVLAAGAILGVFGFIF